MDNQLTLVPSEELPVTDSPKPRRETPNCLQTQLIDIMNELKIRDADLVRATGVPFTTIFDWVTGGVDCQLTDGNLFKVWRYLNKFKRIHLEFLVYGIGDMEDYEDQDEPA